MRLHHSIGDGENGGGSPGNGEVYAVWRDGVGRSGSAGAGTTCDAPGFPCPVPRCIGSLGNSSTTGTVHRCQSRPSMVGSFHVDMRRRTRGGAQAKTVGLPLWLHEGAGLLGVNLLPLSRHHACPHAPPLAARVGQDLTGVTVTSTPWTDVLSPISVFVPGLRTFTLAWVRSCFGHRPL
jgi:hypothetical protein